MKFKTQHKKSEYTLSPREIANLSNSTNSFRDRLIIKCLYYGGMRVSEVANLEVQDIDFDRNVLHIRKSKGGKTRTIPFIDSGFKADLKHFIGPKTKDKVFSIGKRMIQYIVSKTAEKSNIKHPDPTAKNINCHLLRHSIARHLKSAGYRLEWIQKFLGHTKLSTTADSYGTLSLQEMQMELVKKSGDKTLLPFKEEKR